MPQISNGIIPLRDFGRSGDKISILGFGGHHLGDAPDEKTAVEIVHQAVDGGITFYDNCWEYRRGKTEVWMGAGLRGRRDKVFLMTKTCPHGRDASLALSMLDESLRRLQTDHLDLWQVHGMAFENDPELFIRHNGAAEALEKAKKDGKVRFVGFTGHKNPSIHLAMLNGGFPFDTIQMPLNPFDYSYRSFQQEVLPVAAQRGLAVFGMKSMGGSGEMISQGALTPTEALTFAMSLPGVSTTISGMDSMRVLDQNLEILRNFKPLSEQQLGELRSYAQQFDDGRYELFKSSVKYDGDLGRQQHDFPSAAELPA
jgi:aryl-alcohol dehydrogenase-like predicted oxidoreductase